MLTSVDARRRWFGSFFLILAGGFLLWGLTILNQYLSQRPIVFLFYWLTCFGFTMLAFGIAVYDMMVIRRRARDERRAAFNRAFDEDSKTQQKS